MGAHAQQQARETLLELYRIRESELGHGLEADQFFPVNLEAIVRSILGWQIERVGQVGFTADGQEALGRCDFEHRKILIALDVNKDTESQAFTLAHEIGHALLHQGTSCASATLERPVSYRRIPSNASQQRAVEVEASLFARNLLMPEKAVRTRFQQMFGRAKLWAKHSIVQAMWQHLRGRTETIKDIAAWAISTHRPQGGAKSLAEFFGVSGTAMARRVRELGLLYD